ncbi:MAG: competence/damage-inducible protein A [Candidatus Binatia bacterium]
MIRTAAIVSTGDELVSGITVDTNAAYVANRLLGCGVELVSVIVVGDYSDRIAWAWRQSLSLADLVICTGGLGPTSDDLTTETVAAVAGVDLVFDEEQAARIKALFEAMGRSMPENNLKQAWFPEGCEVIPNRLGTAPGYRLTIAADERSSVAVALPGVPREMKAMFEESVLPWLGEQNDSERCHLSHSFQTFGMSESALDEALADAVDPDKGRLAFRASFPHISVRVSVNGERERAEADLEELCAVVRGRLGPAVFAEGDVGMEEVVGGLLRERSLTLATAESCTGGLIGSRVTEVAGSSDYYRGSLVAYSDEVKVELLGVSRTTLAMFGAVSEETATEMALGARRATRADIAVAATGVAGPGGGSDDKPVGTVVLALAADGLGGDGVRSKTYGLRGSRDWVRLLTSQLALDWVRRQLLGLDPLDSNFTRRGRSS